MIQYGPNNQLFETQSGDIALSVRLVDSHHLNLFQTEMGAIIYLSASQSAVDLLDYQFTSEESSYTVKMGVKLSITLKEERTVVLSKFRVVWYNEYAGIIYTCTLDGMLQKWDTSESGPKIIAEVSLYSLPTKGSDEK